MLTRKEGVMALTMAVMLVCIIFLVSKIGTANDKAQTQFVEDAVRGAALTCYAVEGTYPEDLDVLRRNYGLAYDESRYFVNYDAFASNQFPEITVVQVEGDGE